MKLRLDYHLTTLKSELARRQSSNRRYSLRAFARDLGLDPGLLSRFLAGKRVMAVSTARKVAERLRLGDADKVDFIRAAAWQHAVRFLKTHGFEPQDLQTNSADT